MASESNPETGAVERFTNRSARKMRTRAERRAIVEESYDPQTSVARVAREHGVNANQIFNWRKLYQQGLLDPKPGEAKFLRVRLDKAAPSSGRIEIESSKGRVSIEGAPDVTALRVVLEHLLG